MALLCAALAGVSVHAEPAPESESGVTTSPVTAEPLPGRNLKPGERRRPHVPAPRVAPPHGPESPGATAPGAKAGTAAAAAAEDGATTPASGAGLSAAPAASAPTVADGGATSPAEARTASDARSAAGTTSSADAGPSTDSPPAARAPSPRRDYDLHVVAPDQVRALLEEHLDLARADYEEDGIDRDRLDTLIERAERQARNLLTTEGYFSPRIETTVEGSARPWRVTMQVDTGNATNVVEVSVRFVGAYEKVASEFHADPKRAGAWTLHEGDRFRQDAWDRSKDALLRSFLVEEFPEARYARTEARIDPDTREARLYVELDSGPPRFFGEARITGLHSYPPSIVETQNRIKPGTPYNQVALLETQSRLQVLPYFRNVTVTADLDAADDEGRVPVDIAVEEAQTKRFLIGPGFSSNAGARIQAGFTDVNINGGGWRFDSLLRMEQREQLARAGVTLPDRPDGYRDSLTTAFLHSNVSGLELRATSVLLRHGRDEQALRSLDRSETLLYAYSIEKPEGAERRVNQALAPGMAWTYRRIDNLAYPREGFIGSFQVSGGLRQVVSDEDFLRGYTKLVGFLPVGRRDSLTLRLEAGGVLAATPTNVPEMLRFRAGGDQSIRGYAYQSIGDTEGSATVGARYLAIGGAEYTHWFGSEWGMGVFAETGDAFSKLADFTPHTGIGLGPRWRSPIGPLNFDLAWGNRSRQVRLHFSLGFVF